MQMAAIYTRVSSNQQREAHTIASQTAALVEWAATLDLEVPRQWVFEDEGSSFSGFRGRCQSFDLYKFRNCGITLA